MVGTVQERIADKTVIETASGCHLWQGATNDQGYAQIRIGGRAGKTVYVHRLVYETINGPIPSGLELDHVKDRGCRHRNCINIEHLEAVTGKVNILRGDSPSANQARQVTCCRGHDLTETGDVYVTKSGRRQCRICRRIRRDPASDHDNGW